MYIHIFIHIYICIHMYTYVYMRRQRRRAAPRRPARPLRAHSLLRNEGYIYVSLFVCMFFSVYKLVGEIMITSAYMGFCCNSTNSNFKNTLEF